MTEEERTEKIDVLLTDLDDNAKLRLLLRTVFKDAVTKLDDETLDRVYYIMHPDELPEPPPEDPPPEGGT